jgi:hypothetical protein
MDASKSTERPRRPAVILGAPPVAPKIPTFFSTEASPVKSSLFFVEFPGYEMDKMISIDV